MRTIYIDADFKCHLENDGTLAEVQTDFFDGKCKEYIEGFRFVPSGESWTRDDGKVFNGEMIAPWKSFDELEAVQHQYEKELLSETQEALSILLGEVEV